MNKKKIVLSVAMATFNEEGHVADCLRSVKGLADEVVIADESSTDKTREIADKWGAKVFKTDKKLNFHLTKQEAIDRCQGSWILQLDADERVSKELRQEIKKIIGQNPRKIKNNAFWIPRKNIFMGHWLKKTGQYPDPVIRFFKKGKARLPCRSVHEQIEVEGQVGWLKGHLIHYGSLTFSHYLKRANRYSTLTAQKMLEENVLLGPASFWRYIIWRPAKTWVLLFFRHKGFIDRFPGFVFSLFSGFHHMFSYVKYWELKKTGRKADVSNDWE